MKTIFMKAFVLAGFMLIGINILNYNNENFLTDLVYGNKEVHHSHVPNIPAKVAPVDVSKIEKVESKGELKVIQEPAIAEVETSISKLLEIVNVSKKYRVEVNYDSTFADNLLPQLADTMSPSKYLYAVIADEEGFSSTPEYCGGYAVGFGHGIAEKEVSHYRKNPLSKEQAIQILLDDVHNKAEEIRSYFKGHQLTQGEFDSMISVCYNTGFGNFKKKDLPKYLLSKMNITVETFVNTIIPTRKKSYRGLIKRRIKEFYMFSGTYLISNRFNLDLDRF